MEKINFDDKIDGKKQAVFVILYSTDAKPWLHYQDKGSVFAGLDMTVPRCLMIGRSAGDLGFVGGFVDELSLEEAIVKEAKEEIGYTLDPSTLEPIVAHDIGPITTHAYAVELPDNELVDIQRAAIRADHVGSEITGVLLVQLVDYDNVVRVGKGGVVNLLKSSMATSVREELIHLLLNKSIFPREELSDICQRADYKLEELLK